MPNSKVYEKNIFLPGGGSQTPFLKPQEPTLTPPVMPAQINQTGSVPGSMAQAAAQLDPATVLGSSAAKPPQNYFQGSGDTFQLTDYAQGAVSSLHPPTSPTKPYTPSETDPTSSVYDYMLQPSAEEKKLAKDNESKKRLLLLGDALRHIGNLYFTTKGATPQQFSSPVMQQEQIYQQKKQELQAQRAAALKNAMEQAKLNADQSYKNSMLGMRAAELERGLANDQWNRQWTQFKWQGDQANKDREFDFKKANADRDYELSKKKFGEMQKHNRTTEAIGLANAQTSRDRLNYDMNKESNLLKNYDQVQHFVKGKKLYIPKTLLNTQWGYDEIKKFYDYLSTLKVGYTNGGRGNEPKYAITPIKPFVDNYGNTQPYSAKQMIRAIQEAAPTKMYMDWMLEHGAIDPDNVRYTSTRELRQRKQAEANKPQNKYSKYERK